MNIEGSLGISTLSNSRSQLDCTVVYCTYCVLFVDDPCIRSTDRTVNLIVRPDEYTGFCGP